MIDYSPSKQIFICKNKELCYFCDCPTLATLNRDYSDKAGVAWLTAQLTDLVINTNKGALTKEQISMLASLLNAEYFYLKLSEFMLFFYRFKLGYYKEIYGNNFSQMSVTCSIIEFIRERADAYFDHDTKLQKQKESEERKRAITYEEYEELKRKKSLTTNNKYNNENQNQTDDAPELQESTELNG